MIILHLCTCYMLGIASGLLIAYLVVHQRNENAPPPKVQPKGVSPTSPYGRDNDVR